nr:hypothetical protein [Tanacetum cinerariifolium]
VTIGVAACFTNLTCSFSHLDAATPNFKSLRAGGVLLAELSERARSAGGPRQVQLQPRVARAGGRPGRGRKGGFCR